MFIEIDRLKEGISNFTLTTNPQEFEFIHRDATFDDEIKVAVTGIRHEKKIVVGINASTTVKMTCARCLTDFRADLKAEFEFGIELSDSASENVELWEEDFVRVATHNGIVN
ncbi:MAG: YceD family protein, partial [bacterium]